jgi:hypothetical protein
MLAILWDQGLEEYIKKDARYPIIRDPLNPTENERKEQKQ